MARVATPPVWPREHGDRICSRQPRASARISLAHACSSSLGVLSEAAKQTAFRFKAAFSKYDLIRQAVHRRSGPGGAIALERAADRSTCRNLLRRRGHRLHGLRAGRAGCQRIGGEQTDAPPLTYTLV